MIIDRTNLDLKEWLEKVVAGLWFPHSFVVEAAKTTPGAIVLLQKGGSNLAMITVTFKTQIEVLESRDPSSEDHGEVIRFLNKIEPSLRERLGLDREIIFILKPSSIIGRGTPRVYGKSFSK